MKRAVWLTRPRAEAVALAQYAATGCLNSTYYASGLTTSLQKVLALTQGSGRRVHRQDCGLFA